MGAFGRMLHNFWFCLGMAVFSLLALSGAIVEGGAVWIAVDVFCVVWWVYAAYKITKRVEEDPLTNEQMLRIKTITRRFAQDVDEILQEAKDESDRGKDQEADKKESSDE